LEGTVVVVSGGTSGIGARTAELFVAEGASVVIAGRRQDKGEQLARSLGPAASFIRTDVSVEADVKAMIEHAIDRFGRLDCLFNNAGVPTQCWSIENLDLERFNAAIAVHVCGVLAGMKYAVPVMSKQRSGSIINTSSINGTRAGLGGIDYAVAKAAVNHLTRCAAVQLGERGIRVNTISPGPIATGIFGKGAGLEHNAADQGIDAAEAEASRLVNGHNLIVDGGTSVGWPASVVRDDLAVFRKAFKAAGGGASNSSTG
jgi:NAD(P)-dependent dehydrogenase (short-subunit alcohol dehydrogenase family)